MLRFCRTPSLRVASDALDDRRIRASCLPIDGNHAAVGPQEIASVEGRVRSPIRREPPVERCVANAVSTLPIHIGEREVSKGMGMKKSSELVRLLEFTGIIVVERLLEALLVVLVRERGHQPGKFF